MVNHNLINTLEDDDITRQMGEMFATSADQIDDIDLADIYFPEGIGAEQKYSVNEIVEGKIVRVDDEAVSSMLVSKVKERSHAASGKKPKNLLKLATLSRS